MRGIALALTFFGLLPRVFWYPFLGILMWFWISLMNPHKEVAGFFATLPYALMVAVVTVLAWMFSQEKKTPPNDKITWLLVALAVWVSVTSLMAISPPDDVFEKWSLVMKMLGMTILAYTLTNTRQRLNMLIVVCAFSIAVYGIKGGVFTIMRGGIFRVWGPDGTMIGDNNDLGVALVMYMPLLFYSLGLCKQRWLQWLILVSIGLTFIGSLFTYSRGGLLAMAVMGVMLWIRTKRKIAITAVTAVAIWGIWNYAPSEWFDRMDTIQNYQQDGSAESRLFMWQLSWYMALKHPVTGAGFRALYDYQMVNRELADDNVAQLTLPRSPHSIWFEMLGDHGFVGLGLFIIVFLSSMWDARWVMRRTRGRPELQWANNLGRMLQASLVGYATGGSFATLAMYDGYYVLVVIIAVVRQLVATELAATQAAGAPAGIPQLREPALARIGEIQPTAAPRLSS